ncbi:MAG: 2TM domain-containing protein, partial [Actinomycetota bacterium]|nr:2TM domain-containing protein [Actinomycetota bacterium]
VRAEDELRTIARRRLKARKDFFDYLMIWGAVSLLLVAIWFFSTPTGYFWPIWPILGLGIAALFMALDAIGMRRPITEGDVESEMKRLRGRMP